MTGPAVVPAGPYGSPAVPPMPPAASPAALTADLGDDGRPRSGGAGDRGADRAHRRPHPHPDHHPGAAISFPLLILILFWLDRYEPEPARYRLAALGWGGVAAVVLQPGRRGPAVLATRNHHLRRHRDHRAARRGGGQGPVPRRRVIFRRSQVHGLLDGLIYGALVGVGSPRRGRPLLPELAGGRCVTAHFLPARDHGPVCPPAVHLGVGHRHRHRRHDPSAGGPGARPNPGLPRRGCDARHRNGSTSGAATASSSRTPPSCFRYLR